jgi:hypothetical protein
MSALLFAPLAASSLHAAAPAAFGDSFLAFNVAFNDEDGTGSGLFYFGTDGTFKLVSLHTVYPASGTDIYGSSATGTYTYTAGGDDPNQGVLFLTLAQPSGLLTGYSMSLEFTGPTTGTISYAPQTPVGPLSPADFGQGTFSQLVHQQNNFLVNVSNRVTLRTSDTAIAGFVVQGAGTRLVLARVDGPALAQFGVNPVSETPQLALFQGTGTAQIGTGAKWDSGAQATGGYDSEAMSWIFSMAGAFPLSAGSADVAYFGVLSPGIYTAQASDPNATAVGGSALTEVYILPYSG